jgi:hypothetical protein
MMQTTLMFLLLGLFAAMVLLNFYFRVRVLKSYQRLRARHVSFGAVHFFDRKRLEREILPRYPDARADILNFVRFIRISVQMATVLILLITLFGAVLMYYR